MGNLTPESVGDVILDLDIRLSVRAMPVAVHSSKAPVLGCVILFTICLFPVVMVGQQPATAPYFDESQSDRILVGGNYYELALSKLNGSILALSDKSTGAALMAGFQSSCLWRASFDVADPNSAFVDGCSYHAGTPGGFAYSWDASRGALTLKYSHSPTATRQVDATVVISANSDRFFDMQAQIQNRGGAPLVQVSLPYDLQFASNSVQAGYLPFLLPGVRLRPRFFTTGQTETDTYPGAAAFIDYLALDVAGGQLAMYTVNPSGPIQPVSLGFNSKQAVAGNFAIIHAFQTSVPNGSTYTSPVVRTVMGQSVQDTILAFRNDNGIASYPSIQQKLGDRFDTLIRAPLVNAAVQLIGKQFLNAIPELDQFPSPALLHPVGYQPGGLDKSSPDYLPPDPKWGTTEDFAAWVQAAKARDLIAMPYINPTWWDPQSPTVLSVGSAISTIATLNASGKPVIDTYGPDSGYVVCAYAPFVKTRLSSLMAQWQNAVPADYLYLDQIGNRPWLLDYNPASPTPLSYSDGWLAFWNQYSAQGLTTEDGWDRLAAQGTAFLGGPLSHATSFDLASELYGANSDGNAFLGVGNWDPYPMATWLMHDKVLFYEKDLPETTTTENTQVVTFDLEFGNLLKYLWPGNPANPPTPGRIQLAHVLHRTVVPLYAGSQLTNFSYPATDVAMSTFGQLSVIANWQQTATFSTNGNTIIPGGYLATTSDGTLLAGALTQQLNGNSLSDGDHYVIIEAQPRVTTVWQPVGNDTPLSVNPPTDWSSGQSLQVMAFDQDYNPLLTIDFSMDGTRVRFNYAATVAGSPVDHYEVANLGSGFPAVTNAASYMVSPVAPGEIVTLFGPGIGKGTTGQTKVLFDGVAAPLIYVGLNQISAAVPYSVAGKAITTVQILAQSTVLRQFTIPVAATAPGIFTLDQSGKHGGAILNQDNSVNTPSHAAPRGFLVSIYGTGAGQTTPAGVDGTVANGTLPAPLVPVRVQIGGEDAEVLYAGAAPGLIAGALQVNARIPSDIPPGAQVPVVLIIGHSRSAAGVTVAVQ